MVVYEGCCSPTIKKMDTNCESPVRVGSPADKWIYGSHINDQFSFEKLGSTSSKSLSGSMEKIIRVPRKRRSNLTAGQVTEVEEAHKKAKGMSQVAEAQEQEQCEITEGEYHQSLKAKWSRLSQKIILHLGAKEMAGLCQELEVVGSSEELSSVMHSDGTNTTTTAAEISSLQAQVEELLTCKAEQEKRIEEMADIAYMDAQTAKTTEMELHSTVQKTMSVKESLERKVVDLERETEKQATMIEFYGTRIEDLKTRIGELEECLAGKTSKSPRAADSCGQEIRDEYSSEQLLVQNAKLKEELTRVHCQLEVAGFQTELEIEKKDEAIAELMALQNQKATYDATKAELIELLRQKHMFEAEKTELAELRRLKKALEAERDELAELRCQKKTFEAAESELKAVYDRLPYQETLLKAAAEELQTLRRKEETFKSAIEELSGLRDLKATYEAASGNMATLQKHKAGFEDAELEELAALRKQKAAFETVAAELEEARKQQEMSNAERNELELLRRQQEMTNAERDELELLREQRANFEDADGEFARVQDRETAKTAKEQILMAKVRRLILKQRKMVGTIRYLEGKIIEDKREHGRDFSELAAAMTELRQTSVHLQAVEQQLVSTVKEKEILQEEKNSVFSEKESLQGEKNCLLKEKQDLEGKLRHATEHNTSLQFEIERVENAKARLEIYSTELTRELFLKEAKIEHLKAELRWQQDEADVANARTLLEEVKTLREANCACMDQERELKKELTTVAKQLEEAASKNMCSICLETTKDAVLLPCSHMQSCVRCVKELLQNDDPCPTCGRAISGFVPFIPVV